MSDQKSLPQLEALKQRIESDISRSRMQDHSGLSRNTPLMRNYEQVQREINELKNKK